jgi:DNA-binding GntR family transcriptional regulator
MPFTESQLQRKPSLRESGNSARSLKILSDKAYRAIEERIVTLELAPGSIVSEGELAAELTIGRTPVREALQRLAIEGLVTHLPNRGMFVAEISAVSVQEIYEFRALIDGNAARLAAQRSTPEQVAELDRLQHELVRATEDDDIDRYVALDRGFYEVLGAAAHNALLAEVLPRIFNLHLRLWFFISKKTGTWHGVARDHEEMTRGVVEALRHRDPDRAELAMKIYIARRHQDIRNEL